MRYTERYSEGVWCVVGMSAEVERGVRNDSTSVLISRYHECWSKIDVYDQNLSRWNQGTKEFQVLAKD